MKLDIRGYFMHIDRQQLLEIATQSLEKMSARTDIADKDFLLWLTREIILLDPNKNCRIVGSEDDWLGLDPAKSMRFVNSGKGMPIGNLTSQLFSNVYLNEFDQYMKRTMKCRHYGRYVDDAYVVSTDREWLLSLVLDIRQFLSERLGLTLHMGKLTVIDTRYGVEFLGAFVKPYRTYASNACLRRMERNIRNMRTNDGDAVIRSINSFLGVLSHNKTYRIRRAMFLREKFLKIGTFDRDMKTFQ
jgi:hypothetical protein